jgi:hypothetical protein
LLSESQVELIAVCKAGPTTEVDVRSIGAFATYSTQSTSLGSLGGQVPTGSVVAIATSNAGVDGGRFNLVGINGPALNGTFLSFSGSDNTCNYEATAIIDSVGFALSSTAGTARTARTIAPVVRAAARGRKDR